MCFICVVVLLCLFVLWGDSAFGHLLLLPPVFGHLLDEIPVSGGFLPPSPGYPSFGNCLVKNPFLGFPLQALPSLGLAAPGWELGKGFQPNKGELLFGYWYFFFAKQFLQPKQQCSENPILGQKNFLTLKLKSVNSISSSFGKTVKWPINYFSQPLPKWSHWETADLGVPNRKDLLNCAKTTILS